MARLRYSSATAIASPSTAVEILLAPPESGRALRYADLVMPDDAALSPPGVLATTPSGALPDFFGPEGDVATLYALLDDGTTVTLSLAADTGRGTSSALSATPLGTVGFTATPGQVITAGAASTAIDFTGATIQVGDEYYGAGTAADLALVVNGSGHLIVPDGDAMYDVSAQVTLTCDAADLGKLVGLQVYGQDAGIAVAWSPVLPVGLTYQAYFAVPLPALNFANQVDPRRVYFDIDAELLTADAHVFRTFILITKR